MKKEHKHYNKYNIACDFVTTSSDDAMSLVNVSTVLSRLLMFQFYIRRRQLVQYDFTYQ